MPIINPALSTWLTGKIWLPTYGAMNVPFINFSSKQISDRNAVTDSAYGSPYEKIWDVGNTYWKIDFSCPLFVTQDAVYPNPPYYNSLICIYEYLKEMLRTSGFKQGDAFSTNTFKDKWDFSITETINSPNADFIVQKLSLDITESEASFSVSLISTMDLRPYFNIFSKNNVSSDLVLLNNIVYRTVSPFDMTIPDNCIGSPFGFRHTSAKDWLIQMANKEEYSSLLREYHLSLESTVIQVPSIGIPTSRAFLGVNSIKCGGNIKYVPLYFSGGKPISFQLMGAGFAPAGWSVDMQAIDYIANTQRHGGKLQVSLDLANKIYVQAKILDGGYIVNGLDSNTPLGPVSTSQWGLSSSGGGINNIDVDFVTSPGITDFISSPML